MSTKKTDSSPGTLGLLTLGLWLLLSGSLPAQLPSNPLTIQLSSGLIVSMSPRPGWSFIQAELIIPIHDSDRNPALPRLTGDNLFDRKLPDNDTSLTTNFLRLGSDFRIDYRPDAIRLSINFPADQIRDFAYLLQDLFTYKSFSLKRYDFSRKNFFSRLRSEPDWVYQTTRSAAYALLFPDHSCARVPVQSDHLKNLNLFYVRSFFSRVFKPERCLLLLNGDLNPHTTYGMIEMTLKELRKSDQAPTPRAVPYPAPLPRSRIVCLESPYFEQLDATLFTVIPPVHDLEHFQERILYNHLFAMHHGRIFNLTGNLRIRPVEFQTRICHHSNLSVISTNITYTQHLGRILDILAGERRRILQKPFDEREYLVASNILLGQLKVETAGYGAAIEQRLHPILASKPVPYLENPEQLLRINNYTRTVQYLGKKPLRPQEIPTYTPELIIVTGSHELLNRFKLTLSPMLLFNLETIPLALD